MMESEVELKISIEDAPRHSLVWEHFGYPVDKNKWRQNNGQDSNNM